MENALRSPNHLCLFAGRAKVVKEVTANPGTDCRSREWQKPNDFYWLYRNWNGSGRSSLPIKLVAAHLTMARAMIDGFMVDPNDTYASAAVLRKHGLEPDPVIEAYKAHVDRTLLRENLKRTPEERWRRFTQALQLAEEVRRAGAKARGR